MPKGFSPHPSRGKVVYDVCDWGWGGGWVKRQLVLVRDWPVHRPYAVIPAKAGIQRPNRNTFSYLTPRRVSARQPSDFLVIRQESHQRNVPRLAGPAGFPGPAALPRLVSKLAMKPLEHRSQKTPWQSGGTRRLRGEAGGADRCAGNSINLTACCQHQLANPRPSGVCLASDIAWTWHNVIVMLTGEQ